MPESDALENPWGPPVLNTCTANDGPQQQQHELQTSHPTSRLAPRQSVLNPDLTSFSTGTYTPGYSHTPFCLTNTARVSTGEDRQGQSSQDTHAWWGRGRHSECSAKASRGIHHAARASAAPSSSEQQRHTHAQPLTAAVPGADPEGAPSPSSVKQTNQEHRHHGTCHRRGRA